MYAPNWVYVGDEKTSPDDAPPPPQWATGVVHSVERGAARLARRDRRQPADPPLVRRQHRREGRSDDHLPDRREPRRDDPAGPPFTWSASRARRRSSPGPPPATACSALGSWVWDCDHYAGKGERTELHPFRALWVQRSPGQPSSRSPRGESEGDLFVSTDGTAAAAQAECAHRSKGSDAYKQCTKGQSEWQDVNGAYAFELPAPPKPSPGARLRVRVVDRGSVGAPQVAATVSGNRVKVSFRVAAARGRRVVVAKQVFAGWTPMPKAKLPVHLGLRFDSLLVRRAMTRRAARRRRVRPATSDAPRPDRERPRRVPAHLERCGDVVYRGRRGRSSRTTARPFAPRRRSTSGCLRADLGPRRAGARVPLRRRPELRRPRCAARAVPAHERVGNPTGDDFDGAVAVGSRLPSGASAGTSPRDDEGIELPGVEPPRLLSAHVHG